IVPKHASIGVRKHIIGSHVCSSAITAARGVCVFLRDFMGIGRNAHATTTSKLRKAKTNVLDFVLSKMLE
ncbi:hypothetical protein Gotri_004189, partial [Gossypium trilobum]|nr:hypothetical protein [Gossypium trilobum]